MGNITLKLKIDKMGKNFLIFGDALKIMKSIKDQSVDHCITDPPYNISGYDHKKKIGWIQSNGTWTKVKNYSKIDEKWDKFSDIEYSSFTKEWVSEVIRILKPNGNIIIFGSYHNIYQIGSILQDLDRKLINSIVWYKRNAFPNITQRMLCESTEHIIWAVNETKKNAKNWTFNYKKLKELNGGIQMRNMWNIPSTPPSEKKHGKHPSQKPFELINRLVIGGSNKNDTIIDPFMGSGTLPVVALITGRKFIAIDNNKGYCNLALNRIRDYKNLL
jgi:site-specific DNA-methyltransferase (adenine-specific)